jgi:urease subunit gamma/beta
MGETQAAAGCNQDALGCRALRQQQRSHVHISPADADKLLLAVAGMVARYRLSRGVRLNHPEAVALLSTWVIERAREGATVAELMGSGRSVLAPDQVMDGVPEMLHDVQVEATFPDGRKLVTLHHPIGTGGAVPGEVRTAPGTMTLNGDRTEAERISLVIVNTGDRPVQIGSHLHLPDSNAALDFDRAAAHGFRLDIPSGTSVRFEPGVSREVAAVALRGRRRVPGLQLDSGEPRTSGDLDG